jgi:predicted RNA methylase
MGAFDNYDFGVGKQNAFDNYDFGKQQEASPTRQQAPQLSSGSGGNPAKDFGVGLIKGTVGLGEAAVGLADIVSGGRAGKALEGTDFDLKKAQDIYSGYYSPEAQAASKAVSEAKGFAPTLRAVAENPRIIPNTIAESIPSMVGGIGIGGAAKSLAPRLSPVAAGAIGEGAITAGSTAESVRQQSPTGTLTPGQSLISGVSGGLTGLVTGGSGRIADKLGLPDISQLGLGQQLEGKGAGSVARGLGAGLVEGGQETVQSAQEQAASNLALDKPIGENVGQAAALGLVTGAALGAPVGALARPSGPLTKALSKALSKAPLGVQDEQTNNGALGSGPIQPGGQSPGGDAAGENNKRNNQPTTESQQINDDADTLGQNIDSLNQQTGDINANAIPENAKQEPDERQEEALQNGLNRETDNSLIGSGDDAGRIPGDAQPNSALSDPGATADVDPTLTNQNEAIDKSNTQRLGNNDIETRIGDKSFDGKDNVSPASNGGQVRGNSTADGAIDGTVKQDANEPTREPFRLKPKKDGTPGKSEFNQQQVDSLFESNKHPDVTPETYEKVPAKGTEKLFNLFKKPTDGGFDENIESTDKGASGLPIDTGIPGQDQGIPQAERTAKTGLTNDQANAEKAVEVQNKPIAEAEILPGERQDSGNPVQGEKDIVNATDEQADVPVREPPIATGIIPGDSSRKEITRQDIADYHGIGNDDLATADVASGVSSYLKAKHPDYQTSNNPVVKNIAETISGLDNGVIPTAYEHLLGKNNRKPGEAIQEQADSANKNGEIVQPTPVQSPTQLAENLLPDKGGRVENPQVSDGLPFTQAQDKQAIQGTLDVETDNQAKEENQAQAATAQTFSGDYDQRADKANPVAETKEFKGIPGLLESQNATGANKLKAKEVPRETTDLFATPEEQSVLKQQQTAANLSRQKETKRHGIAPDGGELFQQPGIAGQQDLQDIVTNDNKQADVQTENETAQLNKNGKPFTTAKLAVAALKSRAYPQTPGTHKVVPVDGGFGLEQKAPDSIPYSEDVKSQPGRQIAPGTLASAQSFIAKKEQAIAASGKPMQSKTPDLVKVATDLGIDHNSLDGQQALDAVKQKVVEQQAPEPNIIEHTTGKGKVLRGIVRDDLTIQQAKEIDPYTFKKDNGYFVREKHLGALPPVKVSDSTPLTKKEPSTLLNVQSTQKQPVSGYYPLEQNRQKATADKLRGMASTMLNNATAEQGRNRNTNTVRRARIAGNSLETARKNEALANTINNIADAIESGKALRLANVKNKAQVEMLNTMTNQAIYARDSKRFDSYGEREKNKGRDPERDDIAFAKYPIADIHESNFVQFRQKLTAKRGGVSLAASIYGRTINQEQYDKIKKVMGEKEADDALGLFPVEQLKKQARLKSMGINNQRELQGAIGEFITHKSGVKAEDAVTAAERALVGKNVGIDFFPTPKPLATRMAELAGVKPGMRVLEPSAGNGHLADAAKQSGADVDVIEISSELRNVLEAKGHNVVEHDFNNYKPTVKYDAVIMNPPFSNNQDADHIQKAFEMVKPGGRLVAIAGEGAFFRSGKKETAFREWLDENNAEVEKLPQGTFTDKQLLNTTGVNARLVTITKPSAGLSFSKSTSTTGSTATKITQTLRKEYGKVFDKLLERGEKGLKGGVVIVADKEAAAKHLGEDIAKSGDIRIIQDEENDLSLLDKVQGFYDYSTGITTLIADNLNETTASGVFLHEILHGVDAEKIRQDAQSLIASRNSKLHPPKLREFLDSVHQRMVASDVANDPTESANYVVEQAMLLGRQDGFSVIDTTFMNHITKVLGKRVADIVRKFVAAVRVALLKRGVSIQMTVDDMVAFARAGVKQAARGEVNVSEIPNSSKSVSSQEKPIGETITIDGIDRSTKNSEGKPIAQTEEGLRNFYKWFGDSEVVDDEDRPLVVYHGTNSEFSIFSKKQLGENTISNASDYTYAATSLIGFWFNTEEVGPYDKWIPAYLKINNSRQESSLAALADEIAISTSRPFDTDSGKKNLLAAKDGARNYVDNKERKNIDGIFLKDEEFGGTSYAVFDRNQIKSATENTGKFNPKSGNIKFSKASDAVSAITPSDTTTDRFIYNFQNRFIRLKRQMQKVVKDGGKIAEANDPYMAEELYHQRAAHRIKEFYEKEMNPILQGLHKAGLTLEGFQGHHGFLHARHAIERNKAMAEINPSQAIIDANIKKAEADLSAAKDDKAKATAEKELSRWKGAEAFKGTEEQRLSLSGMSDQEAKAFLSGLTPKEKLDYTKLGKDFDAITGGTLDLMTSYRLEKQDFVDGLKKQYQHYAPMYRDNAHPDDLTHPQGMGFSVHGTGLKAAVGSNKEVTNILAHAAAQREAMLRRGEKNMVTVKLANFILAHPDKDFAEVGKVPTIKREVDGIVDTLPDPLYMQKDNVVMMRVDGKNVGIVFDDKNPENTKLSLSLKNLDGQQLDSIESFIAKGSRWIAAVNTQYNIVWGLFNFMRDVQGSLINLSSTPLAGKQAQVFKSIPSAMKIIWATERGWEGVDPALKKRFDQFNANGGTTGYSQMFADMKERGKSLQKELDSYDAKKPIKMFRAAVKFIEDFNAVSENAVRLATFMAGVDNGISPAKSASIAKNISVNFNRKGAQTLKTNAYFAFFNASVQGTARMLETLNGPAGKKIMLGGVALGMASAFLGIAAMGDDEWDKIKDWEKDRSLIIPIGGKNYLKIPMPLGLNILPNIGRTIVETALGSDKITPQSRILHLFGQMLGTFSPLGGNDVTSAVTPTVLDPAVNLLRNEDYSGKSIYQQDFNSLDPTPGFSRAKDTATAPSKWFTEAVNYAAGGSGFTPGLLSPTPDAIDYIFGEFFGGTGREISKAFNAVGSVAKGEELPLHKIPVLGKLAGTTEGASIEKGIFYDRLKILNEHHNEIEGLKGRRDLSAASQFIADNPESRLYKKSHHIQSLIKKAKERTARLSEEGKPTASIDAAIGRRIKEFNEEYASLAR